MGDYDDSKIDDDLDKLLQHIKEEQQNSLVISAACFAICSFPAFFAYNACHFFKVLLFNGNRVMFWNAGLFLKYLILMQPPPCDHNVVL